MGGGIQTGSQKEKWGHPEQPGKVTVAGPDKADVAPKTCSRSWRRRPTLTWLSLLTLSRRLLMHPILIVLKHQQCAGTAHGMQHHQGCGVLCRPLCRHRLPAVAATCMPCQGQGGRPTPARPLVSTLPAFLLLSWVVVGPQAPVAALPRRAGAQERLQQPAVQARLRAPASSVELVERVPNSTAAA